MPVTNLEDGGRVGRYVDLKLLGQGGMGAVYRARDPELDRLVAIKVMLDATPDFVARFRREAQSIARLQHPNIVQVYDFGVEGEAGAGPAGGTPYFVMELIEGTPLDAIVRERGRLQPIEAIRLIRQAAQGLAAAHRAGIVHRDVKPSNLIVDGRGQLKLVDFGIARVQTSGQALTGAAALMGTPGYMAPEQAAGRPIDHRADIYALGLTLFELLSGQPPYSAPDPISLVVKNMQEPLPDLRTRGFGIPDELAQLVEQMGAKEPDERIQSCEAVIAALDDIVQRIETGKLPEPRQHAPTDRMVPPTHVHAERPAAVATSAPTGERTAGKRPLGIVIGAGAVAVGLLVLGLVLVLSKSKGPEAARPGDNTVAAPVARPPEPKPTPTPTPTPAERTGPIRVAVLKFKNVGADEALKGLELGIGESAVTELAGASAKVQLIERSDIDSDIAEIDRGGDFHFDKLTVAKAGLLKGIEYAVQGGFQRAGSKLRITARFVKVETGEVVDTLTVTARARKVFDAQDEVAKGLKERLLALAGKVAP